MVQALQAQDILSDFKTQVQEWKNVLIRGADTGQREKYWQRFQAVEADIQQQLGALIPALNDNQAKTLMMPTLDLGRTQRIAAGITIECR